MELEQKIQHLSQQIGIGAQFGGKYFVHDVRVVRLPRHGASCPVGMGVSCSADRQVGLRHLHTFVTALSFPQRWFCKKVLAVLWGVCILI
mgnify:CR=1 FL=1